MTETTSLETMLDAKGAEYVAQWVDRIRRQHGETIQTIASAVARALTIDPSTFYRPGTIAVDREALDRAVASMTPQQTTAAIEHLRACRVKNPCHYCGLETRNGECEECV